MYKKIFDNCKSFILNNPNKVLIVSKDKGRNVLYTVPTKNDEYICSIDIEQYTTGKFIHISGVNVLFYIVCLFLKTQGNNGIRYNYLQNVQEKKDIERIEILKGQNFIFKIDNTGFIYYPINLLKGTGKFIFDLPPCI